MISKKSFVWLACLGISLFSQAESVSADFVRSALGVIPQERHLALGAEEQSVAAAILGTRYFKPSVSYWKQGEPTAWVLEARGKIEMIGAGFVVEQGQIINSEVLVFRESRGRQICSERFLKQFRGLLLKKDGTLNRKIDGYSGATYSVNAMRKMARLALYLDSLVKSTSE